MTALTFLAVIVAVSVSLAAIMTGAWLAWRGTRNSGWIDTTWTFGLGAVGCAGAFTPTLLTGGVTTRQMLVAVLVAVWSLRLGLHIAATGDDAHHVTEAAFKAMALALREAVEPDGARSGIASTKGVL